MLSSLFKCRRILGPTQLLRTLFLAKILKDAGNLSLTKDLPHLHLIYHRRALSNELLLRAVTGTSFFTMRD